MTAQSLFRTITARGPNRAGLIVSPFAGLPVSRTGVISFARGSCAKGRVCGVSSLTSAGPAGSASFPFPFAGEGGLPAPAESPGRDAGPPHPAAAGAPEFRASALAGASASQLVEALPGLTSDRPVASTTACVVPKSVQSSSCTSSSMPSRLRLREQLSTGLRQWLSKILTLRVTSP